MSKRNFHELLAARHAEGKFVCVGLDPVIEKIPKSCQKGTNYENLIAFNRLIVEATGDIVCAYKPNIAFYEGLGVSGLRALRETISFIKASFPDAPIILDAKRGDIGKTNTGYVESAFNWYDADAITVHPYMGQESLQPFLDQKEKGIIVLCRTSNPGAGEFQDGRTLVSAEEGHYLTGRLSSEIVTREGSIIPLYQHVAYRVSQIWNKNSNCLLVVGATVPEELAQVRAIVDDMPLLIPGIGTQGGDVGKTVKAGKNSKNQGMIINSSSGIIFASDSEDFPMASRQKTLELDKEIRAQLN